MMQLIYAAFLATVFSVVFLLIYPRKEGPKWREGGLFVVGAIGGAIAGDFLYCWLLRSLTGRTTLEGSFVDLLWLSMLFFGLLCGHLMRSLGKSR